MSWIDFRALRQELDFSAVLKHYHVDLKVKGDSGQASGFCPLPGHEGHKRSPSFSANLKRGLWQCFGCGAKGNVIEFACLMENCDPQNSREFHRTARMLQDRFLGRSELREPHRDDQPQRREEHRSPAPQKRNTTAGSDRQRPKRGRGDLPVVVNEPLDFELREIDPEHPYLKGRGLTAETIKHFGLGFCSRGSMKNRIAIPVQNADGELVGYAGRLTNDNEVSEQNPKYKFPAPRERDGKLLEFRRNLLLYNAQTIAEPTAKLIVVEGFASVWWLHQHGLRNVVALMGSSCSYQQAAEIVRLTKPNGKLWLMSDGDDGGKRCAESLLSQLSPHRFVRWTKLASGRQPTDCSAEELHEFFSTGATKSGTSDKSRVAEPVSTSNEKPNSPTAAGQ